VTRLNTRSGSPCTKMPIWGIRVGGSGRGRQWLTSHLEIEVGHTLPSREPLVVARPGDCPPVLSAPLPWRPARCRTVLMACQVRGLQDMAVISLA
jgi:hypothetical protein